MGTSAPETVRRISTSDPRPARRATRLPALLLAAMFALSLTATACNTSGSDDQAEPAPSKTVTLVTHDSFALSDEVLASFEQDTGFKVNILRGGDAVEMLNQAILTKSNPQGDVLFGVDNNLLSRAFDAELFTPYGSARLDTVDPALQLDPQNRVTPIDVGDVCINADRAYFDSHGIAIPETLDDLVDPTYRDMLVVQDPASSTPGLAFMLASIARFGAGEESADNWEGYWSKLRDNGVAVVDGWETAYYDRFSGGSGNGDRPLVVSYATSPAAEVEDTSISPEEAPTVALPQTCYRQIEFAGILAGAENTEGARALIDFLLSPRVQDDIPGQMFVEPVTNDASMPEAFTKFAVRVRDPLVLPVETVGAERDGWVQRWSTLMGR